MIFNRNHDSAGSSRWLDAVRYLVVAAPLASECLLWAGLVTAAAATLLLPFIIVLWLMGSAQPAATRRRSAGVAVVPSPFGTPRGRCEHASAPTGLAEAWLAVGSRASRPPSSQSVSRLFRGKCAMKNSEQSVTTQRSGGHSHKSGKFKYEMRQLKRDV